MKQYLLVEGKDYFAIGDLCKIHFPIPKGYTSKTQRDFLKGNKGFEEIVIDFVNTFDTPELTNIGLVVDADFKGVEKRLKFVLSALSEKLGTVLTDFKLSSEGLTFKKEGIKIGIWIMPNNADNGYLEHFIENLIEQDDWVLNEAKGKVDDLLTKQDCRFTEIKKQKAVIYSWLAWQESPGLPFGTAMKAKYLNAHTEAAQPFLNWIKNTFEF